MKDGPLPNHVHRCWQGTKMYSPMCCQKNYRKEEKNNFFGFVANEQKLKKNIHQ